MLQKAGRWLASRVQGSKGKRKYDDWMDRNEWAQTALKIGDVALMGYAAPKAIAGLKGLLTASAPASAGGVQSSLTLGERLRAGGQAAKAAPSAFGAAGREQAVSGLRDIGGAAARGAGHVWQAAKDNPMVAAMTLQGLLEGQQNAQQMRMQQRQLAMEDERRQNLARLLVPMFEQYYPGGR